MAGRYYSVQLTDPWGTDFAYVGRRTTGTRAGDYLISGPGWQGKLPHGVTQIVSPNNTVLLICRRSRRPLHDASCFVWTVQMPRTGHPSEPGMLCYMTRPDSIST